MNNNSKNKIFFYTETAFIHQGDIAYMMELIKRSKEAGAHGIKFQVIGEYDDFISRANPNYDAFKIAMISKKDWEKIFQYSNECGLDIVYMPCDKKAAEYARDEWKKYISYIDIHPVNFNYTPILSIIKESQCDLILGMGGRTKDEVDEKIKYFSDQIKVLMFGHQGFPTELYQSAIGKIPLLKEAYPQMEIGYADHSKFDNPWSRSLHSVAYMLGARFFEKHIAVNEGENRFDYITSSSKGSLQNMLSDINELIEKEAEFPDLKSLNKSEIKYTSRQLKAVSTKDMKAGDVISAEDVKYKMIESEVGFPYGVEIIGKKLTKDLLNDQPFVEGIIG